MQTARKYPCVKCGKNRVTVENSYDENGRRIPWKPSGETLSHEKANGTTIEHPAWADMCIRCQHKIFREHYKPTKEDAHKLLKIIQEGVDIGDKSLEELL